MMQEPLVSVLTPVYNGERYLAECIESVLAQEYRNFEYIIINNASTDRTLEIANRYAAQDPRIRVHTNEKLLSLVQNHNRALELISPESQYCKFAHADDQLFPECLKEMVRVAVAQPSIALVASLRLYGTWILCGGLPYPSTFVNGKELGKWALLKRQIVFGTPTTVLYRSDVVRSRPRFFNEQNRFHFDAELCFDILREHDFAFVHKVLAYARRHAKQESSFPRRNHTSSLNWVRMVALFGRDYLGAAGYHQLMRRTLWRHYRVLGMSTLQMRGKEFWDYHRQGMAQLGFPIRPHQVVLGALLELAHQLACPKKLYDQLRASRRQQAQDLTPH